MILNPYDENERCQVMLNCSYAAVQTGFRHLAIRFIIDPPHNMFDAALARQIAIHITNVQFSVPRKRIVALQQRQRTSISLSIQAINYRLECPVFARAYERMATRAEELFMREIRKAAA